ncbi:MAG: uroporphyrinogen decarboxylase family protein [Sellimonas intestinalis]
MFPISKKPAIESYGELEGRALPDITKDGRLPILVEAFDRLADRFHEEKIISTGMAGPFTTAVSLVGTERFLRDSVRKKDEIRKLLRYSTDCVISCARDLHERLGISISLSEPMASGNIISKKQFQDLVLPYLSETVEAMNRFQGGTGIHICGKTKDRWDAIVESGISSFSIDNCENMEELKDAYGTRIGISGNVEPVDVLKNGTPEMIRQSVIRCLSQAVDNPKGFTLCPGCTTPVLTPKRKSDCTNEQCMDLWKTRKKGTDAGRNENFRNRGRKADEQSE